ncbi:MAG: SUMF1/EgtB/PvdO family nonheme iron enzyme, partial [Proteobacteria bacterium]|nr:SUMF1/EgtB/PvdO family nonheme iron enzyme [Pseudomonadota bacterium]
MCRELPAHQPMIHVNWFEANAWCKGANRRLPTEAEWEAAALAEPLANGKQLAAHKRSYPWGEEPPLAQHANQDGRARGGLENACLEFVAGQGPQGER